jgi:hypothetical protein
MGEWIATLDELVVFCNRRSPSWWRSIPRIGRARPIVSRLHSQQAALPLMVETDVDSEEDDDLPMLADAPVEVVSEWYAGGRAGGSAFRLTLAPLERLSVPRALSGADAENRSTAFGYIQASHDLDAAPRT